MSKPSIAELKIQGIDQRASRIELIHAIAAVVHSPEFDRQKFSADPLKRTNFHVDLELISESNTRHKGLGTLYLPWAPTGRVFLTYIRNHPIRLYNKNVRFCPPGKDENRHEDEDKKASRQAYKLKLAERLALTYYVDPVIDERRLTILHKLQARIATVAVQFGRLYKDKGMINRSYSIEWEHRRQQEALEGLRFDYDKKAIVIELGDENKDQDRITIVVKFATIKKIATGWDGNPYICFDTSTPPTLEKSSFHRTTTGLRHLDNLNIQEPISAVDEGHKLVAAYAWHLRVVLFNDIDTPNRRQALGGDAGSIALFGNLWRDAELPPGIIPDCSKIVIEASRRRFFEGKTIRHLTKEFEKKPWPIAFQLEALLRNGLLHTHELRDEILPELHRIGHEAAQAEFLRRFNLELKLSSAMSAKALFEKLLAEFQYSPPVDEIFRCRHITFTPTRTLLEGPYATQSNRVIRQYRGFEEHFIRVDFRGEDGLQFHWDRETNPINFLNERVGNILKHGFILAGRQFEILAYSNSALRQHSVWFINPFKLVKDGCTTWITGAYIRDNLGSFTGTELLRCPSKYAARLSQAFTATHPSVTVLRKEWNDTLPDMGPEAYLFTDGVGTISKAMGDRIWNAYCEENGRKGKVQPSAYQIRFLGFKGVVAIDEQLDLRKDGIHMRLRGSMKKFDVRDEDAKVAPLEIANAFEVPGRCYMNRPLVMLLEDLGVRMETLQKYQDEAVADAKTIDTSIITFCDFLPTHKFGTHYGLRTILLELHRRFGMDLRDGPRSIGIDNPFLRRVRTVAMVDVLRDIKHSARIPIPDSYLLVGVADEGPAYAGTRGYNLRDILCLRENEIYACIQGPDDTEPHYIQGDVSISRSPVSHPGDVRRVRAIGKPPAGKLCLFRHLKNVVVLPSLGTRSLASCLGGGDVDGDLFAIICPQDLLPTRTMDAASYLPLPTKKLNRDSTIHDICDFIVEYIHSDMVGLLSTRLLEIADQSKEGMLDDKCKILAQMASHALDFPKQGTPLNIDILKLPRPAFPFKPDWRATGGTTYESSKALGHLFRAIDDRETIDSDTSTMTAIRSVKELRADPISKAMEKSARKLLGPSFSLQWPPAPRAELLTLYNRYVVELRYICSVHALSNTAEVRLLEEAEVVVGTMLGAPRDWKKDRKFRMRLQTEALVNEVRTWFQAKYEPDEAIQPLWDSWSFAMSKRDTFGANSFSWIVLHLFLECLDYLDEPQTPAWSS